MLSAVENKRLNISRQTDAKKKTHLGQFLTPARIAQFMAGLFKSTNNPHCQLLDPGAGIGSLSSAFLERRGAEFDAIEIEAFEIDKSLHGDLNHTLNSYAKLSSVTFKISGVDFIKEAVTRIRSGKGILFTHAILNPPYKKINSNSLARHLLQQVEIETVNLYSAFLALTIKLMAPGGQIVAIIPRSFCNGPYYRHFRSLLLKETAIRHMHLFGSRNKAFKDDKVLQENIIIVLERNGKQGKVTISTSTDDTFSDLSSYKHSFDQIVLPTDPERFIHIPTTNKVNVFEQSSVMLHTLEEVGISVSTGPVVDFRLLKHLRMASEPGTVPLLYPIHFKNYRTVWPIINSKKPNAIISDENTTKYLYPNGFYCVVRRFSAKEEKKRVIASVVEPNIFDKSRSIGFENHLNVFHENRHGLSEALAFGLSAYLNTTVVDEYFRRFNGHTQVNATDLRSIKYPNRNILLALGKWAMKQGHNLDQSIIDEHFMEIIK